MNIVIIHEVVGEKSALRRNIIMNKRQKKKNTQICNQLAVQEEQHFIKEILNCLPKRLLNSTKKSLVLVIDSDPDIVPELKEHNLYWWILCFIYY